MPRWLKLKAAAEYSSIGKHRLKDVRRKLFCDKKKRILRQKNESCDNIY